MTYEPEVVAPAPYVRPDEMPTGSVGRESGAAMRISVVAAALGLSPAALRMWQQRYGHPP